MLAPTIAAITLDETGGGIAAVSRLLWDVARQEWGPRARLLTMFDHESRPATFVEKARFTAALTRAQAFGQTDWILFTHLALAKIHKAAPDRLRRPYGVFLHGIEAWKRLTAAETDTLARAELRIANSRFTAARVADAHPGVGPIVTCPLALTLPPAPPHPQSTQPFGAHTVLSVGRMSRAERYKGHDELIAAWPAVLATVPDAHLVLAGDGDDAPRLKEKAAAIGAGGRILFTGFLSAADLDALYRAAALFALPSRGEGFGLVYLEAMARGLACIGSVHDAAGEVIVDGETGRLVDQSNVRSLAETIAALLLDDAGRMRMGAAGECRVRAAFTFEHFKSRMCHLLTHQRPSLVTIGA
jgi:phosphatidyl-myo-inositol dimannoside synthase